LVSGLQHVFSWVWDRRALDDAIGLTGPGPGISGVSVESGFFFFFWLCGTVGYDISAYTSGRLRGYYG
jgi:hypothetical protein